MSESYQIKLPQFEGPFDLLLFFIERDELDVYDIPISKITEEFLVYIHQMESLNIEVASEFILVASTLMRIKARLLLPRKELDEQGNEIDPRQELVQKLIEYKQFKGILSELKELEEERGTKVVRGNIKNDLAQIALLADKDAELHNLSMYNLMRAFNRVLERYENRSEDRTHTVQRFQYSVEDQKTLLLDRLDGKKETPFLDIFAEAENRTHALFIFLALLEMVQLKFIKVKLGKGYNNFWLKLDGSNVPDKVAVDNEA